MSHYGTIKPAPNTIKGKFWDLSVYVFQGAGGKPVKDKD
jgi:hypothetical protein